MTRRLYPGLYEDLLTSALEAEVNARKAEDWWVDVATAPESPIRTTKGPSVCQTRDAICCAAERSYRER